LTGGGFLRGDAFKILQEKLKNNFFVKIGEIFSYAKRNLRIISSVHFVKYLSVFAAALKTGKCCLCFIVNIKENFCVKFIYM
jgi:hypothetical protein